MDYNNNIDKGNNNNSNNDNNNNDKDKNIIKDDVGKHYV